MANKKTAEFHAEGMSCTGCEKKVKKAALSVEGVREVSVDYASGKGTLTYDPDRTDPAKVFGKISDEGYPCEYAGRSERPKNGFVRSAASALLVAVGAFLIFGGVFETDIPEIDQNASLLLIFSLGLVTGFHCIAMCGGFVLSYSSEASLNGRGSMKPHLVYATSKTLSYSIVGGVFGLMGSFIAFTPTLKGMAAGLAGFFLILYGANMLGIISFRLKGPALLEKLAERNNKSPAALGLANGLLIACGPLQAMYVLAAASGSAFTGALLLLVFGLGTLPVLLGFGALASVIGSRFTKRILRYSGVIVVLLGLVMLNRGLVLTGTGYDFNTLFYNRTPGIPQSTTLPPAWFPQTTTTWTGQSTTQPGYQVIYMNVTRQGWQPDAFTIKKGVPVKWVIDGQEITGCNKAIQVPKLGLAFDVKKGTQTVEFTANEAGVIPWSCWMGMIDGRFVVV